MHEKNQSLTLVYKDLTFISRGCLGTSTGPSWVSMKLTGWRMMIPCCIKHWWSLGPTTDSLLLALRCRTPSKSSGHCCTSSCLTSMSWFRRLIWCWAQKSGKCHQFQIREPFFLSSLWTAGFIPGRILRMNTGKEGKMVIRVFTKSSSPSSCDVSRKMWKNLSLPRWNRSSVLTWLHSRNNSTSTVLFLSFVAFFIAPLFHTNLSYSSCTPPLH